MRYLLFLLVLVFFCPSRVDGYEEFASGTRKDCRVCHVDPTGGPDLTPYGAAFRRGGFQYPIPVSAFKSPPLRKKIFGLIIRYLHLTAGVVWFGTIFYVHIIITPQTLSRGLPKSELALGWICIVVTGSTGVLLSLGKLTHFVQLTTTRFGLILSAKIMLFFLLVMIAAITTFFIQKRLQAEAEKVKPPEAGTEDKEPTVMSHTQLLDFTGTEGQPAYVAVDNTIYDVSESASWTGGRHMAKHFAGHDLTQALTDAPHGREILSRFDVVGKIWERQTGQQPEIRKVRRGFLILARSALVMSFLVLFCVALWR